ncbi:uncharacterized protein LOC132604317 [Lycium barbarum]|uniref:uncharacterized protein LOC132604317 n=1 Tax=Lycium barbarum TaxID=112863 RepID=UPI00293E6BD7|nr:uncharacterized protein LOC132604317 [Lycium barbarum]
MGKKKVMMTGRMVRRVVVPIFHEGINREYFGNNDTPYREYEDKIRKDIVQGQQDWLAEVLAAPGTSPPWIHPKVGIMKATLNIEANFWLSFISSRFWPSQNETLVGINKAVLIACIMTGVHINVGRIMYYHIMDKAWQTTRSIPFPCLITALCRQFQVAVFKRVDREFQTTGFVDILRTEDDESLERQRKRARAQVHYKRKDL